MDARLLEFWRGVRAELPILIGVAPFGMIYGVLAIDAGLDRFSAQAMSAIVFAGSAQFITAQLFAQGAPWLLVVLTIAVVNLRHALYSASVAPYVQKLSSGWKAVLAYLLTDEAYAVTITHYNRADGSPASGPKHYFFLGAGLALWSVWQASTALGILLGELIPDAWPLDFTLPLTFIALVVPTLRSRGALAAALSAGLVALLAAGLPLKLGLLVAALVGIGAGIWVGGEPQ